MRRRYPRAFTGPDRPGPRGLRDLHTLVEVGVPQRDRIVVEAVIQPRQRHTELVLVAGELDAVLEAGQDPPQQRGAGEAGRRAGPQRRPPAARPIPPGRRATTRLHPSTPCDAPPPQRTLVRRLR